LLGGMDLSLRATRSAVGVLAQTVGSHKQRRLVTRALAHHVRRHRSEEERWLSALPSCDVTGMDARPPTLARRLQLGGAAARSVQVADVTLDDLRAAPVRLHSFSRPLPISRAARAHVRALVLAAGGARTYTRIRLACLLALLQHAAGTLQRVWRGHSAREKRRWLQRRAREQSKAAEYARLSIMATRAEAMEARLEQELQARAGGRRYSTVSAAFASPAMGSIQLSAPSWPGAGAGSVAGFPPLPHSRHSSMAETGRESRGSTMGDTSYPPSLENTPRAIGGMESAHVVQPLLLGRGPEYLHPPAPLSIGAGGSAFREVGQGRAGALPPGRTGPVTPLLPPGLLLPPIPPLALPTGSEANHDARPTLLSLGSTISAIGHRQGAGGPPLNLPVGMAVALSPYKAHAEAVVTVRPRTPLVIKATSSPVISRLVAALGEPGGGNTPGRAYRHW
jgi:hypothetical protein